MQENPFRYVLNRFWEQKGVEAFRQATFHNRFFKAIVNYAYQWALIRGDRRMAGI